MLDLSAPPEFSSPLPSSRWAPRPSSDRRAADVGQRLGVDDAGAQFGQIALRAIGVPVVELLGDGQPEHRVAQKLQPLVGRQPAVLVGVAAVRQRHGEQLVGQLDPEGLEQRGAITRHLSSVSNIEVSFAQRGSICS